MKNKFAVFGSWAGGVEYVAVLGMIAVLIESFHSRGGATTLHAVVSIGERIIHMVR